MTKNTKTDIRKHFREISRSISSSFRTEAAHLAASRLVNLPSFKESKRIACYLANAQEFDTSPIIEAIWQAKKQCYVPVLCEENEKTLFFELYQYGDALHLNRYSILEPVNLTRKIAPEHLDLVILPLIAFDQLGHRLGTGGGYYDRTFAFLHAHPYKKPIMMGLGYAAQQAESLPSDPWDILLECVLTECEYLACR